MCYQSAARAAPKLPCRHFQQMSAVVVVAAAAVVVVVVVVVAADVAVAAAAIVVMVVVNFAAMYLTQLGRYAVPLGVAYSSFSSAWWPMVNVA